MIGTSWLSTIADTSAGIIGSKGTILLHGDKVTKKLLDSDEEQVTQFNNDTLMADAYLAQEREFIDCIKKDLQPPADVYAGRVATMIALAVHESDQSGEVVYL